MEQKICRQWPAQWLVSVRDENEFAQVIRCGVDIIDLKEPRRGALAPVDARFWQQAVNLLSESTQAGRFGLPKLSAALGEAGDAELIASQLPRQFSFAKAGPSRCATGTAIGQLWATVAASLHPEIELVAVAYADAAAAQCLPPEAVLREAKRAGLRRCLIDTFCKDGRSSLQLLGVERLARLEALARRTGIWWALAGSLTRCDVRVLVQSGVRPDCFAVRGDVCDQDRTGAICQRRMQAWSELFWGAAVNFP